MTVPTEKVLAILNLFIEGTSVRSTERLTGVHRDTILKVLVAAGEKCESLMGRLIVNITLVKDVECDEIWGFIQKKKDTRDRRKRTTIASAMHTASSQSNTTLDELCPRSARHCNHSNLYRRSSPSYRLASSFSNHLRWFSALRSGNRRHTRRSRQFRPTHQSLRHDRNGPRARYSPSDIVETEAVPVFGNRIPSRICTSIIERQNLTIRMQMRRLTRLTNGFSKKWENLWAAYCLHLPITTSAGFIAHYA